MRESPTVIAISDCQKRIHVPEGIATACFVQVPFYAFLATLAVAIYLNYGTLWYVAFFGIAAAGRVYNSTKNDSKVPVVVIPAILASGKLRQPLGKLASLCSARHLFSHTLSGMASDICSFRRSLRNLQGSSLPAGAVHLLGTNPVERPQSS